MYFHKQSGSESESRPESGAESGSEIKVNAGSEKYFVSTTLLLGYRRTHIRFIVEIWSKLVHKILRFSELNLT
jgi:hypothetical protein